MMLAFVITLRVCVCTCALDGEKAVLGVGDDPDGPVHIDVCGSHHCHSAVFHKRRTCGH